MADQTLLVACSGCCCGRPEPGGPKTPPGTLRREMRRLFRGAGLDGHARLAFSECLGPCSEANVVFAYIAGRPVWLRRMNTIEPFAALLDHLRALAAGNGHSTAHGLPPALASRRFAWTGGGEGPEPPIADG